MVTIAWYNVVAIVVGIIALVCTRFIPKDEGGYGGGLGTVFGGIIWIAAVIIFYTIWGGIFWW